jgi:nitrite reductase (NADH) small subunit
MTYTEVCPLDALTPGRGVAALLGSPHEQVAVFRYDELTVYAIGNRDPFSGAHVIARGLIGSHGGIPTVASPVYKQRFDLRTGRCLDDESVALPVYPVLIHNDTVHIGLSRSDSTKGMVLT